MLCPPIPAPGTDRRRRKLADHPLVKDALGLPLHLLADKRRTYTSLAKPHVITGDVPFGHIQRTPIDVSVTSPLLTLLQMARHIPETHLVMALYEFCGWFSVFKPSPLIESLLQEAERIAPPGSSFGWRRTRNQKGEPTDLWQRPPLVSLDELHDFAELVRPMRGGCAFHRAADYVTGVCASPFEAQTSMLLGLPRKRGGEGIPGFANNQRIPLSRESSRIAGKTNCYADILFDDAPTRPLVIECQGKVAHASPSSQVNDSDRTAALQHMGFDVLPLTYSQIVDFDRFDIIRRLIAEKIGVGYRDKGPSLRKAETALRRDLFISWNMLGSWDKNKA